MFLQINFQRVMENIEVGSSTAFSIEISLFDKATI